jgi:hypothetical protein
MAQSARVSWTTSALAGDGGVSWAVAEDELGLLSVFGHVEGPRNKVVVMLGQDTDEASAEDIAFAGSGTVLH